jgi:chorismate mutase
MNETRKRPRAEEAMDEGRRRIDGIDDQLLRLLNERARCALEIGHAKKALGLPVYNAEREAEILARLSGRNQGPLEEAAVRRLFERIIDESRRLERLAAQDPERGPEGPEE